MPDSQGRVNLCKVMPETRKAFNDAKPDGTTQEMFVQQLLDAYENGTTDDDLKREIECLREEMSNVPERTAEAVRQSRN